jgi:hypothetical protein
VNVGQDVVQHRLTSFMALEYTLFTWRQRPECHFYFIITLTNSFSFMGSHPSKPIHIDGPIAYRIAACHEGISFCEAQC